MDRPPRKAVLHRRASTYRSVPVVSVPPLLLLQRRRNELSEQRMGSFGTRLKFRVELAADEPWVIRQLNHLHQHIVRREPAQSHAVAFQDLPEVVVDLVAMAVAFADFC